VMGSGLQACGSAVRPKNDQSRVVDSLGQGEPVLVPDPQAGEGHMGLPMSEDPMWWMGGIFAGLLFEGAIPAIPIPWRRGRPTPEPAPEATPPRPQPRPAREPAPAKPEPIPPKAPRPFSEILNDFEATPSKWNLIKKETVPSTNVRNRGGSSVQELFENQETGEQIVRHTLLKPNGTIFEPPHCRPGWK
jgi:hypothetical protein